MKRNFKLKKGLKKLAAFACFVLLVVAFAFSAQAAGEHFAKEGLQLTEAGIRKAAVQCYALEGSYPPDLAYLQQHYGIKLDEKYYVAYYNFVAANLMPEITVLMADSAETPAI